VVTDVVSELLISFLSFSNISFLFYFRAQEDKSLDCPRKIIYEGWMVAFAGLTVNLFSLMLTEILEINNHCFKSKIKISSRNKYTTSFPKAGQPLPLVIFFYLRPANFKMNFKQIPEEPFI